jgi:ABC-type arginine transport system permease subunit
LGRQGEKTTIAKADAMTAAIFIVALLVALVIGPLPVLTLTLGLWAWDCAWHRGLTKHGRLAAT